MTWQISGRYMETCNCDYLCPCAFTAAQRTTHGYCIFAMAYEIDRGNYDGQPLDGLKFIVVGHTPGHMAEGNWKVGLIVDEKANDKQVDALTAIVSGQAGGPMANLAPLIGEFLGVERRPVAFERNGNTWSSSVDSLLDQQAEMVMGMGGQPIELVNTGHPVGERLGLAIATKSHLHAFGINWDDDSGRNNGHHAPFSWSG